VLPPHPKRAGNRIDFGRIHFAMREGRKAGGIMVVHGEDEDLVPVQLRAASARKGAWREATSISSTPKLSELLAFKRTIALARMLW